MEYLPSYTDDLYLIHHGIKGQKWGVRRYQNEDGTTTSLGRKRYSKSEKTQAKIDKLQNKINKHDNNVLIRNTLNDYRRGKMSSLAYKRDYQKSKENLKAIRKDYRKGNATKADLVAAKQAKSTAKTMNRLKKQVDFIVPQQFQGGVSRRRKEGQSAVKAILASAAVTGLTIAAIKVGKEAGKEGARAAGEKIYDTMLDAAIKRQQMAHIPKLDDGMITNFKYTVS